MANQHKTIIINLKFLIIPISILLAGIMISGAIFFGLRSSKSFSLNEEIANEDQSEILGETVSSQAPAPPQQGSQVNQSVKTSIDDDAILGDKNTAQVAIIEFSDYECPFCNQFRTETLGQIKEDYIKTGKAIFVYRDLPLPFHNPAAEREAVAAECAREQGGDGVYYQYHDEIFETSPGNGQGISLNGLTKIAEGLGLKKTEFKDCVEKGKYKDEVANDAADAAKAGIGGTPGFVVGKLDKKGNVEGVVISGAQPYSAFQNIIDQQLN